MPAEPQPATGNTGVTRVFRFGPYVADRASGELRKGGVRLKTSGQAFEFLWTLLERPGEIVTRDELRTRIWQQDTYVDFDHALNVMVNRLRELLSDSARSPVYIETVPRKGYRFLAPVQDCCRVAATPIASPDTVSASEVSPARRRGKRWWLLALAGTGAAGLLLLAWSRWPTSVPVRVVPITTFTGSKDNGALSPDGSQIAFLWAGPGALNPGRDHRRNRDVYIKLVESGEPLQLTHSEEDEFLPTWSPDAHQITFLRREGRGFGVYVVPALGGTERRLTAAGVGLSWSPDGKTLAIASYPDERNRSRIVLYSPDTGESRPLTNPDPYSDSFPAFSPDGKTVAFLRSFTLSAREVMTVPVGGGKPEQITIDKRPTWGVAWTGDGSELVYSVNRGGGEALWRTRARAGSQPRRVLVTAQNAFYPSISRDGQRLAFTEDFNDSNIYLYSGADFRDVTAVVRSTREDHSPRISPDGTRLAFVSKRTGSEEIWVANRDGSLPVQLTDFGSAPTGSPRWSPDGRFIAFDSRYEGRANVYVAPAGGGARRRLTLDGDGYLPAWSSDGRWIYFASNRSGGTQIWKMAAEGEPGAPVQITRNGGMECFESPDGKVLFYSKQVGDYAIWTVPSNGGAESPLAGVDGAGYWRSWGVNRHGLYFAARGAGIERSSTIRMLRFDSGKVETLLTVPKEPLWLFGGLTLSEDNRFLLFAQLDHTVNELMLIDNFR